MVSLDPDAVVQFLAVLLRGTQPLPGAACDGRWELYDGREGSAPDPENEQFQLRAAARVCASCIHLQHCRYAVADSSQAAA